MAGAGCHDRLSVLEQPSSMAGLRLKLRDKDRDYARE